MKWENVAVIGGLVAVGYVVYQWSKGLKDTGDAIGSVSTSAGGLISSNIDQAKNVTDKAWNVIDNPLALWNLKETGDKIENWISDQLNSAKSAITTKSNTVNFFDGASTDNRLYALQLAKQFDAERGQPAQTGNIVSKTKTLITTKATETNKNPVSAVLSASKYTPAGIVTAPASLAKKVIKVVSSLASAKSRIITKKA